MKLGTLLFVCLIFLNLCGSASCGEPPTTPLIIINTGMHSSSITGISSDSSSRMLATSSLDKTVKLWDAGTGKLVRTIHPPIGTGQEGILYAIALSPDGKSIATGGITGASWSKGYSVYIFDTQSGEMSGHIDGLPASINRIAYSPDGSRLAVGTNSGVSMFHASTLKNIWHDNSFIKSGGCWGLDFSKNGNLVTGSSFGELKMYRADNTLNYELQTDRKGIQNIKFSPDGSIFAIVYGGMYGNAPVEVRNSPDGAVTFVLTPGWFLSVAWSADGKYIMAAGGSQNRDSRCVIRKWSVDWRRIDEEIVLPTTQSIYKLLSLANGNIAFVSRESGFGLVTGGRVQNTQSSEKSSVAYFNALDTGDFTKNHDKFKIAADGSGVQFSYERFGNAMAFFDLKNRRLINEKLPETELISPRLTADGIDVRNWDNNSNKPPPLLNGIKLGGYEGDFNHSYAIRHDGTGLVFGSRYNLRNYSKEGKLLWIRNIAATAWDVVISADNNTIVVAHGDSSIRWYRLNDGEELYALFLHPDRKRWILWLPSGFFDHGPDSESLIGFHVNRGKDKEAMLIGVNQMYDTFYRPDIIDKAIEGKDVSAFLNNLAKPSVNTVSITRQEVKEKERFAKQKAEEAGEKEAGRVAHEKSEHEQIAGQKAEAEQQAVVKTEKERQEKLRPEQTKQGPAGSRSSTEVSNLIGALVNRSTLPPTVRFITTSGETGQRDVAMIAELCDNGGGIGDVTLFLNDMPVAIENIGRGLKIHPKNPSKECYSFERTISLQQGRNVITLMAYNKGNSIESDRRRIELALSGTTTEKPHLHILTIAVNRYRDGDLQLNYAINDADVMAHVVNEKATALFAGVHIHKLHNADVTKEKLEAVFAEIGKQTRRNDVFLLFVAGHGITGERDGAYYFLPVNFRYTGEESIVGQGVSMNDFKKYLTNIQAMKSLILIDTCNSGSFSEAIASRGVTEKTAITKLARAMGRATIAASSKNQAALEGYEGHGVFSYTVLEGLKGMASNNKGEITVNLLANFIEETLPELTYKKWGYEQIPQKSLQGMDFPIGMK